MSLSKSVMIVLIGLILPSLGQASSYLFRKVEDIRTGSRPEIHRAEYLKVVNLGTRRPNPSVLLYQIRVVLLDKDMKPISSIKMDRGIIEGNKDDSSFRPANENVLSNSTSFYKLMDGPFVLRYQNNTCTPVLGCAYAIYHIDEMSFEPMTDIPEWMYNKSVSAEESYANPGKYNPGILQPRFQ